VVIVVIEVLVVVMGAIKRLLLCCKCACFCC
jgi:hypothetical protein